MKIYAKNTTGSIAIDRIENAIKRYSPKNSLFVDSKSDADLIIFYATGRLNHLKLEIDNLIKLNKKYAIVQLALKTTKNPNSKDWVSLWENAECVWSYYDLKEICETDNAEYKFNFYHAPLGVDDVFVKNVNHAPLAKKYIITTSGVGYLSESVRECILAAINVNGKVFHVGPVVTNRKEVEFSNGMSDELLAKAYQLSKYVSGLRRGEGFELPVIEGLVCGARPIVFDKPHYKKWFEDYAIFIPETGRDKIIEDLTKIFNGEYKPPTKREIQKARKKFDWEPIINGFWKEIV